MEVSFTTKFLIKFNHSLHAKTFDRIQTSLATRILFNLALLVVLIVTTIITQLDPQFNYLSKSALITYISAYILEAILIIIDIALTFKNSILEHIWFLNIKSIIDIIILGKAFILIYLKAESSSSCSFLFIQVCLLLMTLAYSLLISCFVISYMTELCGNLLSALLNLTCLNEELYSAPLDSIFFSLFFAVTGILLFYLEHHFKFVFLELIVAKPIDSKAIEKNQGSCFRISAQKKGNNIESQVIFINCPKADKYSINDGKGMSNQSSKTLNRTRNCIASLDDPITVLNRQKSDKKNGTLQKPLQSELDYLESDFLKSQNTELLVGTELSLFFNDNNFSLRQDLKYFIQNTMIIQNGDIKEEELNSKLIELIYNNPKMFNSFEEVGTKIISVMVDSGSTIKRIVQSKNTNSNMISTTAESSLKESRDYKIYAKAHHKQHDIMLIDFIISESAKEIKPTIIKDQDLLRKGREQISKISHEFKTPLFNLSAILKDISKKTIKMTKTFISLVIGDQKLEYDELKTKYGYITKLIKSIYRGFKDVSSLSNYIISLTHDFNILTQLDTNTQLTVCMAKFGLNQFVERVRKIFKIKIKSEFGNKKLLQFYVEFCKDSNPSFIVNDEKRLMQIILNLLSNSIKFTNSGEIVFSVDCNSLEQYLIFTVRDTGKGMDPETINKIGDLWNKRDCGVKNKDGSGLGLKIVHDLVESIGFDFKIKSELGKGTTISFKISYSSNNNDDNHSRESEVRENSELSISSNEDYEADEENESFSDDSSLCKKLDLLNQLSIGKLSEELVDTIKNSTLHTKSTLIANQSLLRSSANLLFDKDYQFRTPQPKNFLPCNIKKQSFSRRVSNIEYGQCTKKTSQKLLKCKTEFRKFTSKPKEAAVKTCTMLDSRFINRSFMFGSKAEGLPLPKHAKCSIFDEDGATPIPSTNQAEEVFHILLVDDIKIMLSSHRSILEKSFKLKKKKVKITTCEDGIECLHQLYKVMFTQQKSFDAVITDSDMSYMSGDLLIHNINVLKNRNIINKSLFVALLTGHDYLDIKGLDRVFNKPFTEKHCLDILSGITSNA